MIRSLSTAFRAFSSTGLLPSRTRTRLTRMPAVRSLARRAAPISKKIIKAEVTDPPVDLNSFDISPVLKKRLLKNGISTLFPVQSSSFTEMMDGSDVIGKSPTGTGKTLAFALPIVQKLMSGEHSMGRGWGRSPTVLVLSPTRELAKQIEVEFLKLLKGSRDLDCMCIYGGVGYNPQRDKLNDGVDIVVGTPGRLNDLLDDGTLRLDEVETVVLDEADRMLDMGFQEPVEDLIAATSAENRQVMLWSATVPSWVQKISASFMREPTLIDLVGDKKVKIPDLISHEVYMVPRQFKAEVLARMTADCENRVLVFCNRKADCSKLANELNRKLSVRGSMKCEALHGDLSQRQRDVAMAEFRSGRTKVLFATDVAARGLDVPDVKMVIHWEMPAHRDDESFVHRTGRAGRAGEEGKNVMLLTPDAAELRSFQYVVRKVNIGDQFKVKKVPAADCVLDHGRMAQLEREIVNLSDSQEEEYPEIEAMIQRVLRKTPDATSALRGALLHFLNVKKTSFSLLCGDTSLVTVRARGFRSVQHMKNFMQSESVKPILKHPTFAGNEIYFDIAEHSAIALSKENPQFEIVDELAPGIIPEMGGTRSFQPRGGKRGGRYNRGEHNLGKRGGRGGHYGNSNHDGNWHQPSRRRRGRDDFGGWGSGRGDDFGSYGRGRRGGGGGGYGGGGDSMEDFLSEMNSFEYKPRRSRGGGGGGGRRRKRRDMFDDSDDEFDF